MTELTGTQRGTLALFRESSERLGKAVEGLTDEELDLNDTPGGWSIRQIVHHVTEDGDAWSMNFKKAIATPGAPVHFEEFPGNEAWADALAFDKRPIEFSLALIKAHRQVMAELAERFSDAWEQYVVIVDSEGKELQTVSAGQIVYMLGEHMEEHIAKIEEIKNIHGI